jgi:hypothetical protein
MLLLLTIVLVLLYRPPLPRYSTPRRELPAAEEFVARAPTEREEPVQNQTGPKVKGPVEQALSALASLDTVHRYALSRWAGVRELLPTGVLDSAGAADAVTRYRNAEVTADSVRALLAHTRVLLGQLRQASRLVHGGLGYRLSIAYTAADRWLDLMVKEAEDQYLYLRTMEEAALAMAQGSPASADVKQNVANSHRRHSETRQRSLARLRNQVQEATRELGR